MGSSYGCCHGASQRVVCDPDHKSGTSLLYLDRDFDDLASAKAKRRDNTSHVSGKLRGVPVLRIPTSNFPLIASSIERSAVDEFKHMLGSHGVDTTGWGRDGTKAIEHLFWELFVQHGSILTGIGTGKLKRVTRILKLQILADINGVDHVMVSRLQFTHDGQQVQRQQLPLRRLCWKMPSDNALLQSCEINLCDENNEYAESWKSCWPSVLEDRLGICSSLQHQLDEVASAYSYHTEDNALSEGYPGLNTLYCVHQATFRVTNPAHAKVACIGLPLGQDFATADGSFCLERFHSEDTLPIGSQLNVWSWFPRQEFDKASAQKSFSEPTKCKQGGEIKVPEGVENELMLRKRVPVSDSVSKLVSLEVTGASTGNAKKAAPNTKLRRVLSKKRTDWGTVRKMASKMLDVSYTLQQFTQDLAAFPELSLYLRDGVVETGSGRTADDEYQRTMCAFFAIYWLMRLDIDGRQGFCFGTDETWTALEESAVQDGQVAMKSGTAPTELQRRLYQLERRLAFFNNAQWSFFRRLMVDAGLLEQTCQGGRNTFRINETRMVSLLALTAIHDIMKIENLLPTVQPEHDGYHGYAAGDVIGDHDHALCYVMEHYPDLLPSFKDLDPAERQSVQFTQCNLCFNHGWLVQAEAPPGAIFTKFREALARDHRHGGAKDIALYFVHWLTDLAGAEPTPLGGCEKFAIKFPLHVLNSFLQSFKFIEGISVRTETQVMEKYLKYRWSDHVPSLGEPPQGPHALAAMRLLCMAQANGRTIVDAFNQELPSEDKDVLSIEMSRTGCAGQFFSPDLTPSEVTKAAGPAFLVYYGPAFLQALGADCPVLRLRVLSEIYRCARELWPESQAAAAMSVHIRIDTIKGLAVQEIQDVLTKGELWLVTKHNESEAFVERASHRKLNRFVRSCQKFQVLDLGFLSESSIS